MKYRRLGKTDIQVSTVCLGCWTLIGDATWGEQKKSDSVDAINAAFDAGINFFDTAESYGGGKSEELVGEVLAERRDKVIIATKVGRRELTASVVAEACDASLKRLNTDYIDLYQVHWPRSGTPVAETVEAMQKLKQAGKIRAFGVSNFGASYLSELMEVGGTQSNQLCYSALWRPIEHDVQPICVENDISILCYSPLAQGLLTGKFVSADDVPEGRARTRLFSKDRPQSRHEEPGCETEAFEAVARIRGICEETGEPMARVALAWLLHRPAVTSVISGARNADQARENASAGDLELSNDVVERIAEATQPVLDYVGTNADMWQSLSRMEPPD